MCIKAPGALVLPASTACLTLLVWAMGVETRVPSASRAWRSSEFELRDGVWYDRASGARFDPAGATFVGASGEAPKPLEGFDTFWYNWSLTNPRTKLIRGKR